MKNRIIIPLLFLLFANSFAQDLNYEVHGKYIHPIKKEALVKAQSMSDLIPYYPSGWIAAYISTDIKTTKNGTPEMAAGINDQLSTEQKQILSSADLGSDVIITIKYKSKNQVTGNIDTGRSNYSATIIPETEAEYPGGNQQMTQYLKENAINKISESTSKQLQQALVGFTVNEKGAIANAQIIKTTGDPETDKLLLKVINNMPKWSPAEDLKGRKVEQEFEFSVGMGGC
jgi:TonB family protein